MNLFLDSSLPAPDTKGISSSLAILANCLEQMSTSEYKPFAKEHGLSTIGPLLQAYCCSCSAARRSKYTPLFYARNKVIQVMMMIMMMVMVTAIVHFTKNLTAVSHYAMIKKSRGKNLIVVAL